MNTQKLIALLSLIFVFGCTSKPTQAPPASENSQVVELKDEFIITHSFDANIKKVYKMWIKPEKFIKWMGPIGADMSFITANVKVGGTSHWKMTTPDGLTKYGKINYKKMSPHNLLVYTQNFCDKEGKPAKLPIPVPYPDVLLTTVTLSPEGSKKTNMTVKWEIFGEATAEERQTFRGMKPVMTTGWGQSFDKLEALLKSKK